MTKTDDNLHTAFAGESMARNKYTYFAKVADKEGYHYISKIFLETADNEMQHAKEEFKLLNGISNTEKNLQAAMEGEHYEDTTMYPEFMQQARKDGNKEAEILFMQIAKIEREHEARYKKLLAMIKAGTVYVRSKPIRWKCQKCGYIHEGTEPLEKCPCCHHEKEYFEPECMCFSDNCDCCSGIILEKKNDAKNNLIKKKSK